MPALRRNGTPQTHKVADFKLLHEDHITGPFRCGDDSIDSWLKRNALKRHDRFDSRVRVTCSADGKVLAFYALELAIEPTKKVTGPHKSKLQNLGQEFRGFPCVRLAYLGVDKSVNSKSGKRLRLGEKALLDAVLRAAIALENTGGYAVVLIPANNTENFYEKYGFEAYGENAARRMLLPNSKALKQLTKYRNSDSYRDWLAS